MKFSQLAFIVTDDCNFCCSYCPQKKQEIYMKPSTIKKSVDFFYPFLEEDAYIVFYGGEPLLAFETIQYTISLIKQKYNSGKKNIGFSLTTNGSLVTDEMLKFFNSNHVELMVSFDGLAQESERNVGSREPIEKLIQKIQKEIYSNIKFSVNSVFSPANVRYLSASLQYIIEIGVTNIQFDIADNKPWDDKSFAILEEQLADLTDILAHFYDQNGTIPLSAYRKSMTEISTDNDNKFACDGGRKRIAIAPDEMVWGCFVFQGLLRDKQDHPDFDSYSFGKLDDFINNYQWVYPRGMYYYDALSQDYFCAGDTQCFHCDDLKNCSVCPAYAAFSTSSIGKVPPWVCHLNQIQKKEKIQFLQKIESLPPQDKGFERRAGGNYV
jgi:sulfatase maturation enzyme AslB (radical SAM superfamily)